MPEVREIPTSDRVQPPPVPAQPTLTQKQVQQLSASHYAWCPYDDIVLMGGMGLERKVAYDEFGNLATVLKRSELLLFENIETKELSAKDTNIPNGPPPALEDVVKFAALCAAEIADAYSEWGCVILTPLTGMSVKDAFGIFEVIQPVKYDLYDLEGELRLMAPGRINEALARDEKFRADIAEEVRGLMLNGARMAKRKGQGLVDGLRTDMATFQGTKVGKSSASPGDEHAFRQLHQPVPSPIASRDQSDITEMLKVLLDRDRRGEERSAQDQQVAQALAAVASMQARQEEMAAELARMKEAEAARIAELQAGGEQAA